MIPTDGERVREVGAAPSEDHLGGGEVSEARQKVRSWPSLGTTERLGGAYAELCRLEPSGALRFSGALWRSLEISELRRCDERERLTRVGMSERPSLGMRE